MTRQLQNLFDLPDDDEDKNQSSDLSEPIPEEFLTEDHQDLLDKIDSALPLIKGLEASDAELDELASLAKEAFSNLMDLGFQVDSRFASEIFNSASSFFGHSITAKTAKMNKKIKMLDLQLKKADLDRKIAAQSKTETPSDEVPLGQGQVLDRNELIRQILEESKNQSKDK